MKLVVLHNHFDRGDVTQVVLSHLQALAASQLPIDRVLLLHGGRDAGLSDLQGLRFPVDAISVDALSDDSSSIDQAQVAADQIAQAITAAGGSRDDTLLHFHNHCFGEHLLLPEAVAQLAEAGWPIVLQIHDFAEDYSSANYQRWILSLATQAPDRVERHLYPQAANLHYVAATRRDRSLLSAMGVADTVLHRLPPIAPAIAESQLDRAAAKRKLTAALDLDADKPLGIYPACGTRAKNIGELLLWSAVCDDATFAIAAPPTDPIDQKMYAMWSTFARNQQLPVRFDAELVEGISRGEMLAAADFLFTSSVAENGASVFLEAMLAGRPLRGRDLPAVTDDLRAAGCEFPGLSPSLSIPAAVIGQSAQPQIWEAYCAAWGWLPDGFIDALDLESVDRGPIVGDIDFARLPIGLQARAIAAAKSDRKLAGQIRDANPIMHDLPTASGDPPPHLAANAQRAAEAFNESALADRLTQIYRAALQSDRDAGTTAPAAAGRLFVQLARYEAFTPCRTIEL
ncbi:hypothetical protein [Rosistilla oblonga]|uniref:hypothetical protein n=1 Tax=Rosistilla oblonga TaxID=2527990 RepID=UPI003A9846AA